MCLCEQYSEFYTHEWISELSINGYKQNGNIGIKETFAGYRKYFVNKNYMLRRLTTPYRPEFVLNYKKQFYKKKFDLKLLCFGKSTAD